MLHREYEYLIHKFSFFLPRLYMLYANIPISHLIKLNQLLFISCLFMPIARRGGNLEEFQRQT